MPRVIAINAKYPGPKTSPLYPQRVYIPNPKPMTIEQFRYFTKKPLEPTEEEST